MALCELRSHDFPWKSAFRKQIGVAEIAAVSYEKSFIVKSQQNMYDYRTLLRFSVHFKTISLSSRIRIFPELQFLFQITFPTSFLRGLQLIIFKFN